MIVRHVVKCPDLICMVEPDQSLSPGCLHAGEILELYSCISLDRGYIHYRGDVGDLPPLNDAENAEVREHITIQCEFFTSFRVQIASCEA